AGSRERSGSGGHEFREIALERFRRATGALDIVAVTKNNSPKPVPFRLIMLFFRYSLPHARPHGFNGWINRKSHDLFDLLRFIPTRALLPVPGRSGLHRSGQ